MSRKIIWLAAAVVLWPCVVSAQEKSGTAADEEALRKHAAAYVEAYNKHDAKAVAALWSPEAVYGTGEEQVVGREAIEKEMAELFEKDKGSKIEVTINSIQFASPNVAVQRGTTHITRDKEAPEDSEFSAVSVKRDGQWQLDRVTEEDQPESPPCHEALKQLEWLVGNWADESPGVDVRTEIQWTRNQNFLTWSFAASIGQKVHAAGIQVIGYDADKKQFRSWVFDSNGGFAEGAWQQKGKKWFVLQTGKLPDGRKTSAVNIITQVDANTFTWQSVDREIDGQLQPSIEEVRIVRQTSTAAAPGGRGSNN